jgi:hypothetical protein
LWWAEPSPSRLPGARGFLDPGRFAPFRIIDPGAGEGLAQLREAGQGLAAMFASLDRNAARLREVFDRMERSGRVFRALGRRDG